MAYTLTPILLKINPDRTGKFAIKICAYNRTTQKRSYLDTEFRVLEKQWDEVDRVVRKSVANAHLINLKIESMINEFNKKILERELQNKPVNIRAILKGEETSEVIYEYVKKITSEIGKEKYHAGYLERFEFEMERLKKFAPEVTFDDVDHSFLRRYENHLRKAELAGNTIHRIWKRLRSVFNSARRDGITKNNPFAGYNNPKYQQTIRTYLLSHEVEAIENAIATKPLSESQILVGNYFLLGCYSGLRYSDWERFNYDGFVQGERILLRTKKTGEIVSLQMHSRLKNVVERLKGMPSIYAEPKCNEYLKGIAKAAGITKHLTTHVGRHSFAVRCAELDISPSITAELMGISLRTVMVYYRITNRKIDAELAKWDQ